MKHGDFCWLELTTPDPEAAKAHYAALAGWTYEPVPMAEETYWVAKLDGVALAGIWMGKSIPFPVPPHWFPYIEVDDIEAAAATTVETGGEVIRPPFPVPEVGMIAVVAEPGGARVGLMQPAPQED